jgi:DNA-binding PadR family transcriptional regulator
MSLTGRSERVRRLLRKGTIKLLVLDILESRPLHGYEIAKEISARFNGAYEPSPGLIYPTLQWLADQDYVRGVQSDDKTVYSITTSGRSYIKENESNLRDALELLQGRVATGDFPILRSAGRLQRSIKVYLPEMSIDQRRQVAKVLDEARSKIEKMMEE